MKRYPRTSDDSLELLLDTICNMFGGIVFIAILVSLLMSTKAQSIIEQQDHSMSMVQAQMQQDKIHAEIRAKLAALQQLEHTRDTLSSNETTQLIEAIDDIGVASESAETRLTALQQWIEDFGRLDTAALDEAEKHQQQSADELDVLQHALEQVTAQNRIDGRLPQARTTSKTQVIFWLKGQRAYWIPTQGARAIVGSQRWDDVEVESIFLSEVVTPRPEGGYVIGEQPAANTELQRITRAMSPHRHFFDLYVSGDSVGAFQHFKQTIAKRNFDYNVTPVNDQEAIVFSETDTLQTQ